MQALTWLGLLLSAAGIGMGIWALIDTRRRHSHRPVLPWWRPFRMWFERAVLRRRRDALITPGAAMATVGFSTSADAVVIPAADAPIERQIAYLRDEAERLRSKLGEERNERQALVGQLRADLATAESRLRTEVAALEARTESLAADGTWQQVWGLVLVGAGTVCLALPAILGWAA